MKTIILFLIATTAHAAKLETCQKSAEKLIKMQYRLGSDGCNSFSGGYWAEIQNQQDGSCALEVSFSYGGTQVQCSSTFKILDSILEARVNHRIKQIRTLCHKLGFASVQNINDNTKLCQ